MSKKMISKQKIRREIEAKRKSLEPQRLVAESLGIVEHFQTMEAFPPSETVALYKAIGGEVDLDALFSICWKAGKRTFIPIFNAKEKIYEMAEVLAETQYSTGHYGIREPLFPTLYPMHQIDLIAVPGVAFDRKGNRLGRGRGYYDRLLDGFPGVSVAVAFGFQILPDIPCEAHDQSVDAIVTAREIFNVS